MKIKPKIHSMTFQDTRWIKFLYVKSVGSITSLDLVTSENVIVTRFRFIYFLNRLNRICLCLECICTRTSSSPRFLPFRDLPFGYCCCLVAVLFLLLRCCGKVAHLSRNQKKKKRKKKYRKWWNDLVASSYRTQPLCIMQIFRTLPISRNYSDYIIPIRLVVPPHRLETC